MVGVQKRKVQWEISLFLVMLYFSLLVYQKNHRLKELFDTWSKSKK